MADANEKVAKVGHLKSLAAQLNDRIKAQISAVYRPGGSVAFADLPELEEANLGLIVNVTDAFTTTADFVEGEGKRHPAGTNVAIVENGDGYKYDAMSGIVDLSDCVKAEEGKGLSANDYTQEDKEKLSGIAEGATKVEASETPGCVKINGADVRIIDIATDEEVAAMLAEVLGAAGA